MGCLYYLRSLLVVAMERGVSGLGLFRSDVADGVGDGWGVDLSDLLLDWSSNS